MPPKIASQFKPLYAAVLRAGIAKFLISDDFEHLSIERMWDELWASALERAQLESGVWILRSDYTGYAETALGYLVEQFGISDVDVLAEEIGAVLIAFRAWRKAEVDVAAILAQFTEIGAPSERIQQLQEQLMPTKKAAAPKKSATAKTPRPRMFIGSSVEGLSVAKAIQLELGHTVESTIWSQGVFGLSQGTLEDLVKTVHNFDFATLVLTQDDLVTKRHKRKSAPRDNVVFELGLFMGVLGRERTFIVHSRDKPPDLPSDLAGIKPATYAERSDGNLQAAVGSVCTQIEGAIKKGLAAKQNPYSAFG